MTGWTAIVPVKPPGLAKSRLDVEPSLRELLARAFALDVMDAVSVTGEISQVIVVTADAMLSAYARSHGMLGIADRPMLSPDGLNNAVMMGRSWAMRRWASSPVVVIPADLPAVRPDVLSEALDRMSQAQRSFVPDVQGTGTTLLAALDPVLLTPSFGPRSSYRHAADGVRPVIDVDVRLRRDVDTVTDLMEARLLGVGRSTDAALAQDRIRAHRPQRMRPRPRVGQMPAGCRDANDPGGRTTADREETA